MMNKTDFMRKRNRLSRQATEWQQSIKKELNSRLGVGSGQNNLGQIFPGVRDDVASGRGLANGRDPEGNLVFTQHSAPDDRQIAEHIKDMGGNPYTKKLRQLSTDYKQQPARQIQASRGVRKNAVGALARQSQRQEDERSQAYFDYLDDVQTKYDEANEANESRYGDILGRLEDRYSRNMDRVDNFGVAARADIDERFDESLGNQQAELAGRGFGSSTMGAANRGRNDRDRSREQQRLSEMVDSRSADYDQKLSNDVAMFMERRNDVQPNLGQLAKLAAEYGLSNAGRGFNADQTQQPVQQQQPVYQPQQRQQQQPVQGVSPYAAQQMARNYGQMLSPLNNIANQFSPFNMFGGGGGPGITSNRQVENRHGATPEAKADATKFRQARKATLANIPTGYGDGRGGYGPETMPRGYYPQPPTMYGPESGGYGPETMARGYYPQPPPASVPYSAPGSMPTHNPNNPFPSPDFSSNFPTNWY